MEPDHLIQVVNYGPDARLRRCHIQQQRKSQHQQFTEYDKGLGRVEIRTLTCTTWLNDFLDWPGVKQVIRLERIRRIGETQTVEVVYGLASRPQ